jgi:D-alanine-D-alanine ligase
MNVIVLAGGISEEKDVSLASGKAVAGALARLGYDFSVIDPSSGRSLLDKDGRYLLEHDEDSGSRIAWKKTSMPALARSIDSEILRNSDVVFLALHGGHGEDGTIQALLDLAGIKYTGSGQLASAVAMNKAFAKRILLNEGISTPDWILLRIRKEEDYDLSIKNIKDHFSFPLIIKPNNSGSTIGLTLVAKPEDLSLALRRAAEISGDILAEAYIKGREITAAVLDGTVLPLVEIIPSNELYDYQCKYTKGKSRYICPAELPANVAAEISRMAGKACEVIGCAGLARVDFMLDMSHHPFFLEVNTLPGMTELSLAPMAAREAGIGFDELVMRICQSSLSR